MKIGVFGAGYVGLVTGTCFAELGHEVSVYDIDTAKIAMLRGGGVPIYEPGLEELVRKNLAEGRLHFTDNASDAASGKELVFIAVGTPDGEGGAVDLKYVYSAAETIGAHIGDGTVVVTKSTVPMGTAARIRKIIEQARAGEGGSFKFAVASNPEFLREGTAVRDFMEPDRIVIGTAEDWAREKMAELYRPFSERGAETFFVRIPSSELAKYAANAFLAMQISFMNHMAELCESGGADVEEVRKIAAADHRIGPYLPFPGPGYGGSCLPKDVRALAAVVESYGIDASFLRGIEGVNERQKAGISSKVISLLGGSVAEKKVVVWGLSFKPNTDDMRHAPSIAILENLIAAGAVITAYDPQATAEARKIFGDRIAYADDMYDALRDAEVLLILTEWAEFSAPDWDKAAGLMKEKNVVDARNMHDASDMKSRGFSYVCLGGRDAEK